LFLTEGLNKEHFGDNGWPEAVSVFWRRGAGSIAVYRSPLERTLQGERMTLCVCVCVWRERERERERWGRRDGGKKERMSV
jgi:hypothetical protein